jgi:hypothetical protein
MRPKVLLTALLIAGALVGFTVWLASALRAPPAPAPTAGKEPARQPADVQDRAAATASPDSQPLKVSEPLRNGDALQAAGSDSADGILADLKKPGWDIRQAALQRARELDDRSIIPRLREIAARTEDAHEKADILDAIDFLNLPSIDENMAEAQAARAAAGQPDPPQSLTNRWTGRPFVRKH